MPAEDRIRWDARYRDARAPGEPSAFLIDHQSVLPREGRALDVAGGTGRNALWLARHGFDVTLADISEVALRRAQEAAAEAGLAIRTLAIDLELEPFPPGPWDLIVCIQFLWRPLFAAFPGALASNGLLAVAHPTRSNLDRHPRPGPAHLLDDGELPALAGPLEILEYDERWQADGRHEARLLARRSL